MAQGLGDAVQRQSLHSSTGFLPSQAAPGRRTPRALRESGPQARGPPDSQKPPEASLLRAEVHPPRALHGDPQEPIDLKMKQKTGQQESRWAPREGWPNPLDPCGGRTATGRWLGRLASLAPGNFWCRVTAKRKRGALRRVDEALAWFLTLPPTVPLFASEHPSNLSFCFGSPPGPGHVTLGDNPLGLQPPPQPA